MECPNHGGNFDCTPFCELCKGEQEFVSCVMCGSSIYWEDCDEGHADCFQTVCVESRGCGHISRDCEDMVCDYDCPGGCGAIVGVDNDGALRYCWECDKEREGIKKAYLTLAYAIIKKEGK